MPNRAPGDRVFLTFRTSLTHDQLTHAVDHFVIVAQAELDEAMSLRGHCDCTAESFCWPHRVLGLLVPTVEAYEPVI